MQFITSGNRIAVENFTLGDLYTITFTSGTYINSACIGIGENFVSFQRNEPELLFTLTMETAELVSSIDLYAGGTGTNNYADLTNKPQINSVELIGNKTAVQLGLQSAITEESPLSSSLVSGLGSAAAADTSDFATAAQGTLAASAIQSAGTGLTKDGTTLNHSNSVTAQTSASFSSITFDAQGHITGSTEATAAQLDALNSGVTSTDVAQIETNKTNILSVLDADGVKNLLELWDIDTVKSNNTTGTWDSTNKYSIFGVEYTIDYTNNTVNANRISANSTNAQLFIGQITLPAGTYKINSKSINSNLYMGLMLFGTSSTVVTDFDRGGILTLDEPSTYTVYVRVASGETVSNYNFYPMICYKLLYDISSAYTPYALSNADLTAAIADLQARVTALGG